jgi:hypothetical protein
MQAAPSLENKRSFPKVPQIAAHDQFFSCTCLEVLIALAVPIVVSPDMKTGAV